MIVSRRLSGMAIESDSGQNMGAIQERLRYCSSLISTDQLDRTADWLPQR
jgi:hypothetical protein